MLEYCMGCRKENVEQGKQIQRAGEGQAAELNREGLIEKVTF